MAAAETLAEEAMLDGDEPGSEKARAALEALNTAEQALADLATERPAQPSQPGAPQIGPAGSGAGDTPGPGTIAGDGDARHLAQQRINHVARLIGPSAAQRAGARGVAVVQFQVNADGYVAAVQILRSAGNANLDKEIDGLLHLAEPFPAWLGWLKAAVPFEMAPVPMEAAADPMRPADAGM